MTTSPTKTLFSTLTPKGQVTIPAEIRRLLGVAPHDKIAFVVEDDQIRIIPTGSVVARTAGALKSHRPPATAEELREAAEQAVAQEVIERLQG
jgi:AbrB family looped-hinge helix DNA binding protein